MSGERRVEIRWTAKGPDVSHLTGTEARGVLTKLLVDHAAAEELRVRLVQLLAGAAWRECSRGILSPSGEPAMPMRLVLDPAAVAAMGRPWRLNAEPQRDGSIVIVVEPEAAREVAPERLVTL